MWLCIEYQLLMEILKLLKFLSKLLKCLIDEGRRLFAGKGPVWAMYGGRVVQRLQLAQAVN